MRNEPTVPLSVVTTVPLAMRIDRLARRLNTTKRAIVEACLETALPMLEAKLTEETGGKER